VSDPRDSGRRPPERVRRDASEARDGDHTPRTRDVALRRLRSANRWLYAGSAGLTGLFTALAANAFPGKTIRSGSGSAAAITVKGEKSSSKESRQDGAKALQAPKRAPEAFEEEGAARIEAEEGGEFIEEGEEVREGEEGSEAEEARAREAVAEEEEALAREGAAREEEQVVEEPVVSGGS
jgi:hypothetical protein